MSTQKLGKLQCWKWTIWIPTLLLLTGIWFFIEGCIGSYDFGKGMSQVKQGWHSDLKSGRASPCNPGNPSWLLPAFLTAPISWESAEPHNRQGQTTKPSQKEEKIICHTTGPSQWGQGQLWWVGVEEKSRGWVLCGKSKGHLFFFCIGQEHSKT